jgi:hypothetical protein
MCGVSECDHQFSTVRRPWPTGGCCAMVKQHTYIHLDATSSGKK